MQPSLSATKMAGAVQGTGGGVGSLAASLHGLHLGVGPSRTVRVSDAAECDVRVASSLQPRRFHELGGVQEQGGVNLVVEAAPTGGPVF